MDVDDFRLRPARPGEAGQLTAVAIESKAHWGYDRAFMARFAEVIALDADYIDRQDVWVIEHDGAVAGFHGLIMRGELAELDHLWLLPDHIGHGLGRLLFEHAARRAATLGARRLEWQAEPNAVGFYRRMGGTPVGVVMSELGRRLEVWALDLPVPAGDPQPR